MPPENGKKPGRKRKDNGYLKPFQAGVARSDIGPPMATVCPAGHPVGVDGCTGAFCGREVFVPQEVPPPPPRGKKGADPTPDPAATVPAPPTLPERLEGEEHASHEGEMFRLRRQAGKYRARMKEFATPNGLEGKAAEDFADKRAVQLLPYAMAELEYQLKYGDDKQRMEAARDVRDMTGRGKRDGSGGGGPTIILVGAGQNPFLKRIGDGNVVEGSLVTPPKSHA